MPELTFIFGPNNTFFFDCPKSWKFHNIPPTLRQLFNSSMSPGWRIAQPFCLALGPQINSPEPIWYIGCKVVDGQEKIFYSQTYFEFTYPDLANWTKAIPNGPRICFVTFGPSLSYFACAPAYGSIWAGVPSDLTDKVQKSYETPTCVSLGLNQSWYVLWPSGEHAWNFNGYYTDLEMILKAAPPHSVSYLAISPYNPKHYFIAFRDRTVKFDFTGCPEWMPQMQEVFNEWQAEIKQMQAQQQQQYPPQMNAPYAQQQWNNYPPAAQPTYIAAHYANNPGSPPYSPNSFGGPPPAQAPVELAGSILATPPGAAPTALPRSISTDKKRGFLSKMFVKETK